MPTVPPSYMTWGQTYERCRQLASSPRALNIVKNNVVSLFVFLVIIVMVYSYCFKVYLFECSFHTVMVENKGFMPTNNNMPCHFSTPEHIKTI